MPQETDRLKLPLPLGNENVTRESINGIFEKIDAGVATQADLDMLREAVSQMDIPDASLTQKGKVQLSSKTDGTSETVAATEKAVRDALTAAKAASLSRTGGAMTGRLIMNQWGTISGSSNGSVLYGSNCFLDGSNFKYENDHTNLGARGIYMRYTGGAGPEVYMFDTGAVATTAGATFTPVLYNIVNNGDLWQKHKLTNDNGVTLNISNQNINNLIVTGFYAGENITNAPTTAVGAWWYIQVISMSGSHIKQIAMDLFGNTYQQRTNNGTAWTAWSPDVFQSGVNAKQSVVDAINARGGSASTSDTWAQLAAKIQAFSTPTSLSLQESRGSITLNVGQVIDYPLATIRAGTKYAMFATNATTVSFSYATTLYAYQNWRTALIIKDKAGVVVEITSATNNFTTYIKSVYIDFTNRSITYIADSTSATNTLISIPSNFDIGGTVVFAIRCSRLYSGEDVRPAYNVGGRLLFA
ncbi:pyocin knob domain-containing protein [Paenibacillus xylanexedens]|uniref:pyocin knob domain-containing protein n=1 Tax=Paenibacillus xylanexedens TaxID=528191 RepID=UPI003CFFB9A1